MNKVFHKITSILLLFAFTFGSYSNAGASVFALPQDGVGEAVVYEPPQANGVSLTSAQVDAQFGLIIYAYKQLQSYPGRSGTELIYFDINKINGPTGLSASGSVCSTVQKTDTNYYSDTVTVGFTFCSILDAIKSGTPVYGIAPTESMFLHDSSGARLSKLGSGGATYLINPADPFIRNYTIQRYLEKITELGIEGGFADNLQPGWNKVTSAGTPVEYSSWTNYNNAMAGFACEIYSALKAAGKDVWGNLTSMDQSIWAQYSACLDGAMAETWIMYWGESSSASEMTTDLLTTQTWLNLGKKVLLIAQDANPTSANNQFVYANSLLVGNNSSYVFYKYAHYNGNYSEYFAPPVVSLGNPKGPMYQVSTNVWERSFDTGCVHVDLSALTSLITGSPCNVMPTQTSIATNTPQPSTPTPSPTLTTSPTSTSTPASNVTPSTEKIYDDKYSGFSYSTGWTNIASSKAYKGTYKETTRNNATATLAFTGQSFSILYKGGASFSKLDVYVDGVLVGTLNQKLTTTSYQNRWDYPGQLAYGNHTLKLVFKTTSATVNRGSLDAVVVR